MNKAIMEACGFAHEVRLFEHGMCPFCGQPRNHKDFRDETSLRESKISGLCQPCQDEMFPPKKGV